MEARGRAICPPAICTDERLVRKGQKWKERNKTGMNSLKGQHSVIRTLGKYFTAQNRTDMYMSRAQGTPYIKPVYTNQVSGRSVNLSWKVIKFERNIPYRTDTLAPPWLG